MPRATAWKIKLNRAEEHLEELGRRLTEYRASGTLRIDVEKEGARRNVRLIYPDDTTERLSGLIGDVVHNLRSALDTVAFAACMAGADQAGQRLDEKQAQDIVYPIYDRRAAFESATARKRRPFMNEEAVSAIEAHQPFYMTELLPDAEAISVVASIERSQMQSLWRLKLLSNIDKHRSIHLLAGVPDSIQAGIPDGIEARWDWTREPWPSGSIVGYWTIVTGPQDARIEPGGWAQLAIDIDSWIGGGRPPVDLYLGSLKAATESAICALEATF